MIDRLLLESTVLGMALEKKFGRVNHILSTKNFSVNREYNHQAIWKAMEQLYPTEPIDTISVASFLLKKGERTYHRYLSSLTNFVVSDNIEYYSLQLLELDIREKLSSVLSIEEAKAISEQDFQVGSLFKSMGQMVRDYDRDLFDLTDSIRNYLERHFESKIPTSVVDLLNSLPEKIREIKSANKLRCLLRELCNLEIPSDQRVGSLITELNQTVDHLNRALDE
ncbi:DnaB-like helicase N-terminal domain-containing protein [Roseivirga misakiensis]|uniref:DNA helicase DnaB-like N-terminal domain-containing protein n=1 Tax=Roseivirga misakiensis TaxID=1563681 RepID=A0A1E5T5T3_9BACT|nr:DnaB-like helicase N-terminal domain-containing protein [Roseivirga misakiensis]OEK06720.1 hypothetical protein BFP71_03395 [Roseivirga misakiensis]